jgi:hypothetical protein
MLERQINSLCAKVHSMIFENIYKQMPSHLRKSLNEIIVAEENQVSFFSLLKESPPAARISTLKTYLNRYKTLEEITLEKFDSNSFSSSFSDYLFLLAKYYNATDLKRFNKQKRLSLLICFLIEARKELLDNLIKMHDQFMVDLSRRTRNRYEKKHKQSRRKNKRAVDVLLKTSDILLNWESASPFHREDVFEFVDEDKLRESVADLYEFKYLSEKGYADLLISHYPSLRKYFSDFLNLPFEAEAGSEELLEQTVTNRTNAPAGPSPKINSATHYQKGQG